MITLATLPQATAQQVYDQVKGHLLTQMKKSMNPDVLTECLYYGPNGLKCAAGCLTGDQEYDPKMENKTWKELADRELAPANHCVLISALQGVHDEGDAYLWPERLGIVANFFNLIP